MRSRNLSLLIAALFMLSVSAFAQTSWLDRPLNRNWNRGDVDVPQAPRTLAPIDQMCRSQIRTPESLADRAVTRAGWSLFGASQTYGPVTVVEGMASADGMCRPNQYNAFVFVNNRFAGTLSPDMMMARSDGALNDISLNSPTSITGVFARYTSSDALCCPSQSSTVTYSINTGARAIVKADTVDTNASCPSVGGGGGIGTMDNVVSGTATYRGRSALPPTAVLTVRLLDVSRADAPSATIVEQRVEMAGKQVPVSFDLVYERNRIQERNRYAVRAEIRDGDRLLFTTDTSYPVITQGNPKNVEIVMAQVGGGGGGSQRDTVIRGTVTYRQRIAMPPNSEVRVSLVDAAEPTGRPAAETTVSVLNRQVPIAFELPYEMRDINRQRSYEVWAEIRSGGQVRFRSEAGVPVTPRPNQPNDGIEIVVAPASDTPEPITGRSLNLSKIGLGTMQIGTGNTATVVRASVAIRSTGDATVTLNRIGSSVTFTGKLTFFEANSLRITVQNSGNASASGEFDISYSGGILNSITSRSLVMDGQDVTIRF